MAEIKPAEVSAILRKELSGYQNEAELEEVGTVLQIGDGIARIYGLNNATATEAAISIATSTTVISDVTVRNNYIHDNTNQNGITVNGGGSVSTLLIKDVKILNNHLPQLFFHQHLYLIVYNS